jgi:hypothetical protein
VPEQHIGGFQGMSEAKDYYNTLFGPQLLEVAHADSGWSDRISLVGLIPGAPNATPGQARAFASLEEKHRLRFLMCYFYSALLDQAIHAGLREEHPAFDNLARYPKLVGILGSAWSNLHPANLLVAATLHMQTLSSEAVLTLFDEITSFMADEYIRFFTVEYPAQTDHLRSQEAQQTAIHAVLREAIQVTTPPEPDLWRDAFNRGNRPAKWPLAEAMIQKANTQFSKTLEELALP